jgi:hypothetical protein
VAYMRVANPERWCGNTISTARNQKYEERQRKTAQRHFFMSVTNSSKRSNGTGCCYHPHSKRDERGLKGSRSVYQPTNIHTHTHTHTQHKQHTTQTTHNKTTHTTHTQHAHMHTHTRNLKRNTQQQHTTAHTTAHTAAHTATHRVLN